MKNYTDSILHFSKLTEVRAGCKQSDVSNKPKEVRTLIQFRMRHIKRSNSLKGDSTAVTRIPERNLSHSEKSLITDPVVGSWKLKNPDSEAKAQSRLVFHRNGTGVDNFYEEGPGKLCSLSAEQFCWSKIGKNLYRVNNDSGRIRFPNPNTMMIDDNEEPFIRVS